MDTNQIMGQFGKISSLLVLMLNQPTERTKEVVIGLLEEDNEYIPEVKHMILNSIRKTKKSDDSNMNYDYSLNESIKKEFNRFL
jgi:seryl-tRNA(Sec) selenium transferase